MCDFVLSNKKLSYLMTSILWRDTIIDCRKVELPKQAQIEQADWSEMTYRRAIFFRGVQFSQQQ